MPKILEEQGFRLFFFSSDCEERVHIHIKKGDANGKIWLAPEIEIFYLQGFKKQDVKRLMQLIETNIDYLIQEWHAYCNNR